MIEGNIAGGMRRHRPAAVGLGGLNAIACLIGFAPNLPRLAAFCERK
jgi:hypothetical protein